MDIEGKIIMDLGETSGTSKAGNLWKKHEWVLETFGQYPRKVKFTIFGNKVDTVHVEVGKSYKVSVDVESREFNGRWYTDVNAFAAQEIGAPQPSGPAPVDNPFANSPLSGSAPVDPFAADASETDDLPF